MYFASECLQILLLCAASLCGDGKTHTICDESVVPPGATSISLDVNLSVNAFNAVLEHSRETIVEVEINDVPITIEHYRTICRLPRLKSLEIRSGRTQIDYSGFSKVCPPKQLQSLRIVNEVGFAVDSGRLDSSEWHWVFRIPTLHTLSLQFEAILTDTNRFKCLPHLKYLSLPIRGNISGDALYGLRNCQSLEVLSINEPDRLSENNIKDIAAIPKLTMLNLMFASKTDHLYLLKRAKRLEWLILSRNFIDSEDFEDLVKALTGVNIIEN